ncbi:MAG: hypothetical protein ABEJ08_00945 [Halobacteriaceae archaeon]
MDRISALRNVETALAAYEEGEVDLDGLERQVLGTLRTYATEFEADDDLAAFRAVDGGADGTVVVAPDRTAARDRVETIVTDPGEFDLTRLD